MQPKPNIVHLPVYQPGKPIEEVKRELGLTHVTKLASNENPFGCSPKVREAMEEELNKLHTYPDGGSVELSQTLADFLGVKSNQLIFGAGSDEVILMIARAFLVPGDETIMATHTFPQYKHNVEIENAKAVEIPLIQGTHDLAGMLGAINERTKIVWICNPNNPTGTLLTHDEIAGFLQQVPDRVLVVLDEAYCEYDTTGDYPRTFELLEQHPNVIALRTFSKIYGLASLRIGYGIGHPDVIHTINQVREPFNTTRMAQAAAKAAISDQDFIESCRLKNSEELRYLNEQFKRLNLEAFPAHGNFIMVNTRRPAAKVFEGLLRKGFIVRSGDNLDFPSHIRVTVGNNEQNKQFVAALEQILADISVNV
ncbi:histidinol-phosphate transaminase [Paenibacillus larvae]